MSTGLPAVEESPPSEDDPLRVELPWTKRSQELIVQFIDVCQTRSRAHDDKCKQHKLYYRLLSSVLSIIPLILVGIHQVYPRPLLSSIGFICTGTLNTLQAILNFGKSYQLHSEFSAKYEDLARSMTTEVCKPKRFRTPCDVFLKECEMLMNALTKEAPDL